MCELIKPPKSLLRRVGRAIANYHLIKAQDRILIALSGGKDSLSLLHILAHLQRSAPIDFEIAALTIDPQVDGFDPSRLKDYLSQLKIPYYYRAQPIVSEAQRYMRGQSFCAYCARMKRGIMYATAREYGYNVLALAQHLDDLAESFFMSALYSGALKTMKVHYVNDAGDVRVIRPLALVRERQTADFAKQAQLPVITDSCPACFAQPTQRAHIKAWLATEEAQHPQLFRNLLSAIRPLMSDRLPEDLSIEQDS